MISPYQHALMLPRPLYNTEVVIRTKTKKAPYRTEAKLYLRDKKTKKPCKGPC